MSLLSPLADKQGVTIDVQQERPVLVNADPGQIQQCLTNLIMNAIQSMPDGGSMTIHVGPRRMTPIPGGGEHDYLCLSVTDDGEGMARDVLERIFEPFFTTKKAGEGTGLGLSISQQIVRDHGGWIDVESEIGRGSRFDIYLPMGEA